MLQLKSPLKIFLTATTLTLALASGSLAAPAARPALSPADAATYAEFLSHFTGHWKGYGFFFKPGNAYERFDVNTYVDARGEGSWRSESYIDDGFGGWVEEFDYAIKDGAPYLQDSNDFVSAEILSVSPTELVFKLQYWSWDQFVEATHQIKIGDKEIEVSREGYDVNHRLVFSQRFWAKKRGE
jgi:hypothetical protein